MIHDYIARLVEEAVKAKFIEARDRIYARNQLMAQLHLTTWPEHDGKQVELSIPAVLEELVAYAIEQHIIADVFDEKEVFQANLMNIFLPSPSQVEKHFYTKYHESPVEATNYFYDLSKKSNYIQMARINKNIHFNAPSHYGELEITINLSKPEKDPEQIKREREMKRQNVDYPKCPLCIENEGYEGRTGYAARSNHRMIRVPMQEENWYLQYSPYIYYKEHSILLSETHRDMVINRATFERLLLFVEKFPHYFIGSNADLPIVGGSILSHDHYQAGNHTFAMDRAESMHPFTLEKYPDVEAHLLKWPLSVIRLQGKNSEVLAQVGEEVLQAWKGYSDESVGIIARTADEAHNTITPIARMNEGKYELDLVLRNNRTSKAHPMGIFHPHEDVQHIKKENIGLIEVMGLAVLPARLVEEMEAIKAYVLGEDSQVTAYHQVWAHALKEKYDATENVEAFMQQQLGAKFERILEDAGVFKQDEAGIQAFQKFVQTLKGR